MIHHRPDPTTDCPAVAVAGPSDTRHLEAPDAPMPPPVVIWDSAGQVFRFFELARFLELQARVDRLEGELAALRRDRAGTE